MEFLYDYGLFLAKTVSLVIAILIVIMSLMAAGSRSKKPPRGHIEVLHVNDQIKHMEDTLRENLLSEPEIKSYHKQQKKDEKRELKDLKKKEKQKSAASESGQTEEERKPRLYIVDFLGDIQASAVSSLREEITAILTMASELDEVMVRVESPGGMVHGYGLASAQLLRIVKDKIRLTVAVDKVAASGGYLMACMANTIIAAPFALLGSIGVVAQIPNFHRLLKKNEIDVDVLTAGEYKRTLTMFGENTEKGKQKFQEELEDVHQIFKEFVAQHRPSVNIAEVATGEAWYGTRALERNLVDELKTSDEFIMEQCETKDVYQISYVEEKSKVDRLMERISAGVVNLIDRAMNEITRSRQI